MNSLRSAARVATAVLCLTIVAEGALATDLPPVGGRGGQTFWFKCPNGQFLVGIHGRTGLWVDQIAAVCATWSADTHQRGPHVLMDRMFGGNGGSPNSIVCPAPFAISGWEINQTRSDTSMVMFVKPDCRSLADRNSVFDTRGRIFGSDIPADQGFFVGKFGATPVTQTCPPNEFAAGIHGGFGAYVDRLGLICGPLPTPVAQSPGRPLGKTAQTATARDDVDIYDGPDGSFRIVGMMRAGEKARSIQRRDGWRQLAIPRVPGGYGWVAEDHLTVASP